MKTKVLIIVFLFFITGCTIGPDYERPDLSLPLDYKGIKNTPTQLIAEMKVIWSKEQKKK